MTEFLFLDLDDTILDFHKAERIALSKTLRQFGVEPTEEVLALYHKINLWHWEQLEQGKLTREEVLVGRFAALLRELGVSADRSCPWGTARFSRPKAISLSDTISSPAPRKR